jgi:DNA invertase Pin-like site-specific DNA recombinase
METGKYISYLRVSTDRQGKSGLGLDAQRKAIDEQLHRGNWLLLKEFVEVESGKNDERLQLKKALETCERTGAKLLVAKLDRLSRDLAFIANIMKTKVEFIACDFPDANRLTIHILSAMAEYERELISKRTKDALKASKARGKKLGNPQNLNSEAAKRGRLLGTQARQLKADEHAQGVYETIKGYQDQGMSLNQIARLLTENKVLTSRGKDCRWTATAVKNIIKRLEI